MKATRRTIAAAGASIVLVAGVLGVSFANADAPGQTYTGCLKLGLVFNVAVGTSPLYPCPRGAVQISWNQTGLRGADGAAGADGTPGKSAYEIWLDLGNSGTPDDFIASLRGPAGADGSNGLDGADGNLALAGRSCPEGPFVTGFDQSGDLVCGRGSPPPPPPAVGADCEPLNLIPGADLHHCDLGNTDLSEADLSNAFLGSANRTGANLTGANLASALLTSANLTGANLTGA